VKAVSADIDKAVNVTALAVCPRRCKKVGEQKDCNAV
jgi:hypothetical protein